MPITDSEVVYRISRWKATLLVVGGALFAAGGVWMAHEDPIGWAIAAFFGLCAAVGALMLTPFAGYLKIDREGIEIATIGRRNRIAWKDIESFHIGSVPGTRMIAIDYSPQYTAYRRARKFSAMISGMEGAIPNHYTARLEEILHTLEEWRERYGGGAAQAR